MSERRAAGTIIDAEIMEALDVALEFRALFNRNTNSREIAQMIGRPRLAKRSVTSDIVTAAIAADWLALRRGR